MSMSFPSKRDVLKCASAAVEEKISEIKIEIEKINEDAARETKSSMGDKYETGREMIEKEQRKLTERLSHLLKQKVDLELIEEQGHETIKQGSLVRTSQGMFFIATALGPIKIQETQVFVLSKEAPLARQMMGKREGEPISFNQRNQEVLQIW